MSLLNIWPLSHHLETCEKCRLSSPTLDLLNLNLVFSNVTHCFVGTVKLKKHWNILMNPNWTLPWGQMGCRWLTGHVFVWLTFMYSPVDIGLGALRTSSYSSQPYKVNIIIPPLQVTKLRQL